MPSEDTKVALKERDAKTVRVIEAVQALQKSAAWSTLKTEIFDNLTKVLRNELFAEAKKEDPNSNKLNRISGKLEWAEKFSDLEKFEKTQRVELTRIRTLLGGTTDAQ